MRPGKVVRKKNVYNWRTEVIYDKLVASGY